MATRFQFIPGRPCAPHSPLARYRPVQPVEAVGSYVRRLSRPGDLVVDLFCQGPTVIREAVAEGRRALGVSVNPVLLTASRLGLIRRDADALNSAFTRLLHVVSRQVVPQRPLRVEPRVRKRRPKKYPLMTRPRAQLKAQTGA